MENPWNIQSIYDLQYFNCPACVFKNPSKQEIVNHAYDFHPESIEHLMNIDDNSLMDVSLPWDINVKKEVMTEEEIFESPVDSLEVSDNDDYNSLNQNAMDLPRIPVPPRSNDKPSFSYGGLIAMAIQNSPGQKLTLQEIYDWIQGAFPYYAKINKSCWQNAIRHNLSLNKAFYRRKEKDGKAGNVWRIDINNSAGVFKKLFKGLAKKFKTKKTAITHLVSDENEKLYSDGNNIDTTREVIANEEPSELFIDVKKEIETEGEYIENPVEFEYPMNIECIPDIKIENNYDEQVEDMHMVKQGEIGYIEETQEISSQGYKCEICDKIFDSFGNLKSHYKKIHGGKLGQKDHRCGQCEKAFFYSFHLKLHIKNVHEGIKDYKCEECGKTFSQSHHLKSHIKVIHEGQKEYKCEACDRMFSQLCNLKKHNKVVHEGIKDTKEYKCETCGKIFSHSSGLSKHVKRVHEGERKHACEICGKRFTDKGGLKYHLEHVHRSQIMLEGFL